MAPEARLTHHHFVQALQGAPLPCVTPGCSGPVEVTDTSHLLDRIKTFTVQCPACGWRDQITGRAQAEPPWGDAALLAMADEHLMHQQPTCPNDGTPVVFTSLPNPRRRARYRLSCFYCGRHAEMEWPPPESRR